MKIFSGKNYNELTNSIVNVLNTEHHLGTQKGNLQIDQFSDGEILPLFRESIRNKHIYFVNTLSTSDEIIETFLVLDAAMRAGCKRFTLVAPFMGYSRQDKTDHLRSSIGAKMLANLIQSFGSQGMKIDVITIDLHAKSIQGFYDIPVIHLNGNKIFIDHIKKMNIEDLCVVAPDGGAVSRASDFCKAFPDATFAMINKKRTKPNEIHSMELVGDVKGKNVLIVDDMTDTGKTLSKATDLLLNNNAKSVYSVATHGILSGPAIDVLNNSKLTKVLVSESLSSTYSKCEKLSKLQVVPCSKLLAKSIYALSNQLSINSINSV